MAASWGHHWLKISSHATVEVQRIIARNNIKNCFCTKSGNFTTSKRSFDERLLDVLACPLSKKPLRYDAEANELISDDLGVAYPIVNGIPNLNPHDGRMFKKANDEKT